MALKAAQKLTRNNFRLLKTLNPERMHEVDQEVFPLAENVYVKTLSGGKSRFFFKPLLGQPPLPKMPGLFYYYRDPRLPEIAGELRFRFCNKSEEFGKGEDFMASWIRPWFTNLHWLCHYPSHQAVCQQLVDEEIVSQDIVDDLKKPRFVKGSRYIYHINQDFEFDLEQTRVRFVFTTRHTLNNLTFWGMTNDFRDGGRKSPFSGCVRARFELSTEPQHLSKGPTLVLRITQIMTPIKSLIEGYDNYLPKPEAGGLLLRKKDGRYEPWSFPLKDRVDGQIIKEFIRLSSTEQLI